MFIIVLSVETLCKHSSNSTKDKEKEQPTEVKCMLDNTVAVLNEILIAQASF